MTDLIQITDAFEKFNVHPNTIRWWIRLGAIAATKMKMDFGLSKNRNQETASACSTRLEKS